MKVSSKLCAALLLLVLPASRGYVIDQPSSFNELDNLDDFSWMIILDMLHCGDLLHLASITPRLQQLIESRYLVPKCRLHERGIVVTAGDIARMRCNDDGEAWFEPIATTYDEVLRMLQSFGHIFKHLTFEIYPTIESSENLVKLAFIVNKYCSEASQKIGYTKDHENAHISISNISFWNATDVSVYSFVPDDNDPIILNSVFPRMEELSTNRGIDLSHHYPHLTNVTLSVVSKYTSPVDGVFNFMALNPQLRSIDTPVFNNIIYLSTMARLLPDLKSMRLVVKEFDDSTDVLPLARFRAVTTLEIDADFYEMRSWSDELKRVLSTIRFNHLEALSVISTHPSSYLFVIDTMVVENPRLKKLSMQAEMDFDELCRLIEPLTALKELQIKWNGGTREGDYTRFLEHVITNNHTLQKFVLHIEKRIPLSGEDVLQLVPVGWMSTYTEDSRLLETERAVSS